VAVSKTSLVGESRAFSGYLAARLKPFPFKAITRNYASALSRIKKLMRRASGVQLE
jgi:hypothetical protein